jgi:hypothetical protein
MKFKALIAVLLLMAIPAHAFAANSLIEFMDSFVTPYNDSAKIMTFTPNPALTITIPDAYAHSITLATVTTAPLRPVYFNLIYNGGGTCTVRIMNSATAASWPAYTVTTGTEFGRGLYKDAVQLRYSGCAP